MPTSASDAVAQRPTVEDEMAKFKGFSTTDGETSNGEQTAEEATTLAAREKQRNDAKAAQDAEDAARAAQAAGAKPAAALQLTDEESEAAIAAAQDKADHELTDEEVQDVLVAATAEKNKPTNPDAGKPKKSVQERINKAVRNQRAAERELAAERARTDSLVRRLEALEAGRPLTAEHQPSKVTAKSGAPDPKQFELGELDPAYVDALVDYKVSLALQANEHNARQEQTRTEADEAAAEFAERKASFEEAGLTKYDDFEEVVMSTANLPKTDPASWPLSAMLGELLLSHENGPDVAYELASNPKEARRIFGLPLGKQAAWFGEQVAKLSSKSPDANAESDKAAESEPKPKTPAVKVTKAPSPVKPARGAGGSNIASGNTTDFAAFEQMVMGRRQ